MAKFRPQIRRGRRKLRKRGGRGRRAFKRAGATVGSVAYSAWKLAKRVANAVNIEYKVSDATANGTSIDYSGTVTSLMTNVAQGTSDAQRIGDSLKVQNLTMRYVGARVTTDSLLRVMVVWDPQNKVTAASDVLGTTGSGLAMLSPKNYDKRFQTRVLYDRLHMLTSNEPFGKDDFTISIDQHTQYNAGSTTVNSGDLKLLFISNVTATGLPTITYYTRLSFTDD